ncbi:MAG TPA: PKD domain-containing protein, partial [Bacteroidia bacterium]|nr:PKD domain-containing protein [Bacteroidia bacterium]
MKLKSIFTAVFFVLTLCIQVKGQTFQRTFGAKDDDKGNQVLVTKDNNYAIIGYKQEKSSIYLIKTNLLGNTIWQKTFGPSMMTPNSFKETNDGGFIIAGTSQPDSRRMICLIKTNASGDTLWAKSYTGSNVTYPSVSAHEVILTADGGYAVIGTDEGTSKENFFLLKTDSNGNLQWAKSYGGSAAEIGNSLKQTTDGGYILAGYTGTFGKDVYDVYLVKVNATGTISWTKNYGAGATEQANHIELTKDKGFIITGIKYDTTGGAYDSDLFLMKTDSLGNKDWSYAYGGNSDDAGTSVKQTTDGGFIATGFTASSGAGQEDVYLLKTDAQGNVSWSKNYGGSSTEQGNEVIQQDKNYIIVGETRNFSKGGTDVYLIKTDSTGKTTCKQGTALASKTAINWVQGTGGTEISGSSVKWQLLTVGKPDTTSSNPCDCVPPVANFYAAMTDVTAHMTDLSTWATSWHWDFGNGDTSNVQNAIYNWNKVGTFKVCLTVKNECGIDTACQTVTTGTGIIENKDNLIKLT